MSILLLALFAVVSQASSSVTLSITSTSNQWFILGLQGLTNTDYAILATTNLSHGPWTNVGAGATGSLGSFQLTDTAASSFSNRFYRAVPGPVPTTTIAAGLENNDVIIALAGFDPLNTGSALTPLITQLPSYGILKQFAGTAITSAGTTVTDPQNRVRLTPATNATGNPYSTLGYGLVRGKDGAGSPAQLVAITVSAPTAPVATLTQISGTENVTMSFALTVSDPNPPPGGGALSFFIVNAPVNGRLYQVAPDNVTRGTVISGNNIPVTNTNGLVIYIPPSNVYGSPYESFDYRAQNSYGLSSASTSAYISLAFVDQPPTATSSTSIGENDVAGVDVFLNWSDPDQNSTTFYFTSLPALGTLYYGSAIVPSNAVVLGHGYLNNTFLYVSAQPYASGNPYAQFTSYVQDSSGLTSAVVTNYIDIQYVNTPPTPTGPSNYTLAEDTSTNIVLTATDVDGNQPDFWVNTLPPNGKLYFNGYDLSGYSLPVELVSPYSYATLRYVPGTNYNNLWGPESFTYTVRDQDDFNPNTFTISLNVTPVNDPPVINGQTNVIVTENTNGVVTQDGTLTGLSISDDAWETGGAKMFLLIQAVNDTGAGVSLYSTSARGLAITYPATNQIKLEGTEAAINSMLMGNSLHYHPSSSSPASTLNFTINDEGNTGPSGDAALSATVNLPVIYVQTH